MEFLVQFYFSPLDTSIWVERETLEKEFQEFIHENEASMKYM